MATKWTSPVWRMPENSNQSKLDNYSLDFDGTGDYVNCGSGVGDSIGNSYTGGLSVSLWFKADTTNGDDGLIWFSSNPTNSHGSFSFNIQSNFIRVRNVTSSKIAFTDTTSWHHLVAVMDASASTTGKIYLDGALQSESFSYSSIDLLSNVLYIGTYYNTSSVFDGKISQTAIFDYALSETQVKYLYNNNAGGSTPNPQNPMAIAGPTPIAYYPLGGSSTGSSSTLTIPNESGSGDTVFDYDGSNDFIDVAYSNELNLGTNATWSMWLNWENITKIHCLASRWDSSQEAWYIQKPTAQNIEFNIKPTTGSYSYNSWPISGFSGAAGSWFHLCFVFDASIETNEDKLKLYVNSTPQTPSTTFGSFPSTLPVTTSKMRIGEFSAGFTGRYFEGLMSNFQIWNTNLSASEITTLYNGGRPYTGTQPQAANLKGWWKMDVDDIWNTVLNQWEIINYAN